MKCKGGCDLSGDDGLLCGTCDSPIFWADSDERYAICQKCPNNGLQKLSGKVNCGRCEQEAFCTVKWIKGYTH